MTTKTRMDLAKAALREIRILRAGETPNQAQKDQSDEKYDAVLEELKILDLVFWSADAIPLLVFQPIMKMVAQELAPAFRKEYSAADAMTRLRVAASRPWSGKVVRAKYY
jgi:hypothetical protein